MIGPETLDSYIKSAQGLGALSASAVWAVFCIYLVNEIRQCRKIAEKKDLDWQNIRVETSVAMSKLSDGVLKLGDAYEILAERIQHGGRNV